MAGEEGMLISAADVSRIARMLHWFERRPPESAGKGPRPSALIPFELRRFELYEDLEPSSDGSATTAMAYFRHWDEDTADYVTDYDEEILEKFEVTDPQGKFWSRGRNVVGSLRGAYGTAWKPHDCAAWEILQIEEYARECSAQLAAALATSDTSKNVDTVAPLDGGLTPVAATGDTLSANNPLEYAGADNQYCEIHANPVTQAWRIVHIKSSANDLSDLTIRWNNSGSHKLEYTKDGGSSWTEIDTAVTC